LPFPGLNREIFKKNRGVRLSRNGNHREGLGT
jgi:hypothetical protein